jgi:hypothetical protein
MVKEIYRDEFIISLELSVSIYKGEVPKILIWLIKLRSVNTSHSYYTIILAFAHIQDLD